MSKRRHSVFVRPDMLLSAGKKQLMTIIVHTFALLDARWTLMVGLVCQHMTNGLSLTHSCGERLLLHKWKCVKMQLSPHVKWKWTLRQCSCDSALCVKPSCIYSTVCGQEEPGNPPTKRNNWATAIMRTVQILHLVTSFRNRWSHMSS